MKVIFRSNNHFAKKSLRNNAEVWVESLNKYLSDDAVLNLSLFVNEDNIATAKLNIVDKNLHVHATHEDVSFSVALESVVEKCAKQIVKKQSNDKTFRDTVRFNNEFSTFEELDENIELDPSTKDAFLFVETERKLANMKKTSRYNRTINRYLSYLYRNNKIERTYEHLRVLYSILDSMDEEKMTVADHKRLLASIMQLEKEVTNLTRRQATFENSIRDQEYINDVYEKEATLAKLKTIR